MPRRTVSMWFAALVVGALAAGCGGGGAAKPPTSASPGSASPTTVALLAPTTTQTTQSPIEGVQTFSVQAGHSETPVSYPDVPPVGGIHNPVWVPCTFYDRAVPNEMAVHSLEHGAIWITYRPDLPAVDVDALATLARSRKDIVASRWDSGLPSPLVATAWGRQLRLQSTADPRLAAFIRLYANQGPELNAPC